MDDKRSKITWELVCFLYKDKEADAPTLASQLQRSKTELNSILYDRSDYFNKRDSPYSAKPIWSLTRTAIQSYDLNEERTKQDGENTPDFCPECQSLFPRHTILCTRFSQDSYRLYIPSTVNHGQLGLPGFFGIRYSEGDSNLDIENRREDIKEFLITEFIGNESNQSYVELYDVPRSEGRREALINHYLGINVPSSKRIQSLRLRDADWLRILDFDKDLQ